MYICIYIPITGVDKYVSRDGILDYLQVMCVEIAQRTRRTSPDWCGPAPEERPVPCIERTGQPNRYCTEVYIVLHSILRIL